MAKKQLDKAAAETRREYFREWRRKNSEKIKQYNADYWHRQAERKLAEEVKADGTKTTDHDDGS